MRIARAIVSTTSHAENRMIYVVATIELNPGARTEFLALQRDLLPLVRAEQGCLEYTPSVDVALTDPPKTPLRDDAVVMQEKWETLATLNAHAVAPHMKAFRDKVKHLVQNIKVEVFESA
jgi:quinol monooxygenase YgiN